MGWQTCHKCDQAERALCDEHYAKTLQGIEHARAQLRANKWLEMMTRAPEPGTQPEADELG